MPNEQDTQPEVPYGILRIDCEHEQFQKLILAICDETGHTGTTKGATCVTIYNKTAIAQRSVQPSVWRDKLALCGCAVIGFLLLFVFVAGITQIINWF
jgi:hypothetical protein